MKKYSIGYSAKKNQIFRPRSRQVAVSALLIRGESRIFKESLNMQLFLIDNSTVATLQNQIFIGSDTGKA
jgi:hypothetical protein